MMSAIFHPPSSTTRGTVLTATAWQDVCTKFHRGNIDCAKECIKSDQYIVEHLHEANPAISYKCPHGLVDNAIPIIIEGVHCGSFFTGQFFLEPPDLNFFRVQARKYGFDEEEYVKAVKQVPIWSREQLDSYLFFIKGLIEIISSMGSKKLKELEAGKRVQASEERHRTILRTAMDGFWLTDMRGRILEVNETYCRMSGYSEQELLTLCISDLEASHAENRISSLAQKIMAQGENRFETRHRRKDGSTYHIEASVQYRPTDGGRFVFFLRDITGNKRTEMALDQNLATLHRKTRELESLLTAAKTILDEHDFMKTARHIFDVACGITKARAGYVALLSADGKENDVIFLEAGGLPCSVDPSLPMPLHGTSE